MSIPLNEGFKPYVAHIPATDPQPFREAADVIEAGGSVVDALAMLTDRHRTTLFRLKNRPPLPMLADAGDEAESILRGCAARLEADGE